jgi:hypothetical protein
MRHAYPRSALADRVDGTTDRRPGLSPRGDAAALREDALDIAGDVPEAVRWIGDARQIASRATREHKATWSLAAGSREEAPMETRPFETSETPTLDPPWRIRNPNFLPCLVLIHLRASWVSSGKTEVDPLIVMIFFA